MFAGLHRGDRRTTSRLIFLHQRHFDSLDLCYMRGLLDNAAGGPGGTVLPLCQVGQGHGGVDLLPVCLVFAFRLFFLCGSGATAAADERADHATRKDKNRERYDQLANANDSIWSAALRERLLTCHIYLIHALWFLKARREREKKVNFAEFIGVNEDLLECRWTYTLAVCVQ